MRYNLEPGDSTGVMSLIPSRCAGLRMYVVSIDFDREAERCFFSSTWKGEIPRSSFPSRAKEAQTISPTGSRRADRFSRGLAHGQIVAARVASPAGLLSPAIYDCETEQTRLYTRPGRQESLAGTLANAAVSVLKASLPPAMADGQLASRPTLLPLPGELPPQEPAVVRINRLARFGGALLWPAIQRLDSGDPPAAESV